MLQYCLALFKIGKSVGRELHSLSRSLKSGIQKPLLLKFLYCVLCGFAFLAREFPDNDSLKLALYDRIHIKEVHFTPCRQLHRELCCAILKPHRTQYSRLLDDFFWDNLAIMHAQKDLYVLTMDHCTANSQKDLCYFFCH